MFTNLIIRQRIQGLAFWVETFSFRLVCKLKFDQFGTPNAYTCEINDEQRGYAFSSLPSSIPAVLKLNFVVYIQNLVWKCFMHFFLKMTYKNFVR